MTNSVLSIKSQVLHKKLTDFYSLSNELISNELVHSKSFEDKLIHVFQHNPLRAVQSISHVALAVLLFMQLHPHVFFVQLRPLLLQWIMYGLIFGSVIDIVCNLQPYQAPDSETLEASLEKVRLSLLSSAQSQASIGIMFALIFIMAFSKIYRKSYQSIPIPFRSGIRLLCLSQILPSSIILLALASQELFQQYSPFINSWWISDTEGSERNESEIDRDSKNVTTNDTISSSSPSKELKTSTSQTIGDFNSVIFRCLSDIQQYGDLLLLIASLSMWKVLIRQTNETISSVLFTIICSLIMMQISYLTLEELSRGPSCLFYSIRQILFSKDDARFKTISLPTSLEEIKSQGFLLFKKMKSFGSWLGRTTQSLSISSSFLEIDFIEPETNHLQHNQERKKSTQPKKSSKKRNKRQSQKRLSQKLKNRRDLRAKRQEEIASFVEEKDHKRNVNSMIEEAHIISTGPVNVSEDTIGNRPDQMTASNYEELFPPSKKEESYPDIVRVRGTAELERNEEQNEEYVEFEVDDKDTQVEESTKYHAVSISGKVLHNHDDNSELDSSVMDTPIIAERNGSEIQLIDDTRESGEEMEEMEEYYAYESQYETSSWEESDVEPRVDYDNTPTETILHEFSTHREIGMPVSEIDTTTNAFPLPFTQSEPVPDSHQENLSKSLYSEQKLSEDLEEENWEGDEDNFAEIDTQNNENKTVTSGIHIEDTGIDVCDDRYDGQWNGKFETTASESGERGVNSSLSINDNSAEKKRLQENLETREEIFSSFSNFPTLIEEENGNSKVSLNNNSVIPSEHNEKELDDSDSYEYDYEYSEEDSQNDSVPTSNQLNSVVQEDSIRVEPENFAQEIENNNPNKRKEEESGPTQLLDDDDSAAINDPDEIILDLDAPKSDCNHSTTQEINCGIESRDAFFTDRNHIDGIPSLFEDYAEDEMRDKH